MEITYTWWYLLTEETETETWKTTPEGQARIAARRELGEGLNYKVNSFTEIVANMEYHMKNETLDALAEAGFVTISAATLAKEIPVNPLNPLVTKRVGTMTISEFISIVEQ